MKQHNSVTVSAQTLPKLTPLTQKAAVWSFSGMLAQLNVVVSHKLTDNRSVVSFIVARG